MLQPGDGGIDAGHRLTQVGQLDRQLHGAGGQEDCVSIAEPEAVRAQCIDHRIREAVDGKLVDRRVDVVQQAHDLGRHPGRRADGVTARADRAQPFRSPHLVDRREAVGEVLTAEVLEEHGRPGLHDEQVARRRAHGEQVHVPGTGGIEDVDRIEHEQRRHTGPAQVLTGTCGAGPVEIVAGGVQISRGVGRRRRAGLRG